MWIFRTPQKTFKIGNIEVGGYPGERPTLLIGSIFYRGHKIVSDEKEGIFDREKAEALIKAQEEYSDKTGLPHVIDIIGGSPKAIVKYIDYVSSVTDGIIGIDGITASVRIEALKYIKESGVKNAIIYNSLSDPKEEELNAIKESGVKNAILLTINTKDFSTNGRIIKAKDLLSIAERVGIESTLIDTCVLDIPSLGMACEAIYRIKDEFGLPAGCGVHNAIALWRGVREKIGDYVIKPASAVASAIAVAAGADFILYGPIENAKIVFPTIAMVNVAYSQLCMERGKRPDRSHPRYKIA
ncbi:MAG: tetrahydromethanopterin S-methyltransferase subunit H [Nitrososphaerota archaeon]|nr:tetrahydromethanopterin S-methyltransferase subunit H [Nitrososphaerales archaeon]MCX8191574.1 tetrahydromethanopterin S-methyltransferase subunit H [Nitrososphaerales archaeon]MDW8045238.1 tetrahydromethanopterin S-methyltransferase subunit H [Nitrososphaerota archaeon]